MHLAGGDADLGPHAKFAPICKLGRSVVHQNGAVQLGQEPGRGRVVFGQDTIGVVRTIGADMIHRRVQIRHNAGGDLHIQILFAPVLIRGGKHPVDGLQPQIGMHMHARIHQGAHDALPDRCRHILMDQQAFGSTANTSPPCLGIEHNLENFFRIGVLVDIDMHDAFEVGKDGNTRLALHQPHKTLAATGHNHIDGVGHGQHFAHRGAVAGGHKLHGVLRQVCVAQALLQSRVDGFGRMKPFGAAAQDHRIARLEAQRAGICRHIGPAFIDHTHDAQRRAHPLDIEARGLGPIGKDFAHGVGLFGHGAQAVDDALNAVLCQVQTVHHGVRQPFVAAIVHVLGIGGDDVGAIGPDMLGRTDQGGMFARGAGKGEGRRRRFGALADVGHETGDICEIFHRSGPVVGGAQLDSMPPAGIFTAKRRLRGPYRPCGSMQHGPDSPIAPQSRRCGGL
mmetsp:Transcript_28776/g.54625  ORF Transcript_28776/g.54625 Transcript_28776/m.54625 type:complete len:451 (-) Transcript_28776:2150-3502(-)